MLIKIGIVAGLVILGGMIFYNELDALFPSTASTVPESLAEDVEKLGGEATGFVEERINESAMQLESMTGEAASGIVENIQGVQERIIGGASSMNPIEPLQEVLAGGNAPAGET